MSQRSLWSRPLLALQACLLACLLAAATAGCSSWTLRYRLHLARATTAVAAQPSAAVPTARPAPPAAAPSLPSATGSRQRSGTSTRRARARPSTRTIEHWGAFFGGAAGNYDTRTRPTAVQLPGPIAEVGSSNSTQYALLLNGRVYAWGLGTQGQLGDGGTANSFTKPVRVQFPAGVKIASIPADAMPYDTGLAIDTAGNVWGWGRNGFGDLCLGNSQVYLRPVKVPLRRVSIVAGASNHVIYDSAGSVYACGQNLDGDLGDGQMLAGSKRPVLVAGLDGRSVVKLVASFADSGALLADGRYLDWGYNGDGQLGDGQQPDASDVPVQVNLRAPVIQLAEGGSFWGNGQTLALLADGSLWSWGDNSARQLGTGQEQTASSPVQFFAPAGVTYARLATGTATSYAVSTTGNVYAWGTSVLGQAGDGHKRHEVPPELVASRAIAISSTANNVVILKAPRGHACRLRPSGGSVCPSG